MKVNPFFLNPLDKIPRLVKSNLHNTIDNFLLLTSQELIPIKTNMSSTDFGKTSVFDVENMAYDITGSPKNTKDVIYPTGIATSVVAPFEEDVNKSVPGNAV